jgi:hypothetical protein
LWASSLLPYIIISANFFSPATNTAAVNYSTNTATTEIIIMVARPG